MKRLLWLLIVLPILGVIIAVGFGVPVLDWIAWLFDFIAKLFAGVGKLCRWLQKFINWGIIK